jgi:hypothetical protein
MCTAGRPECALDRRFLAATGPLAGILDPRLSLSRNITGNVIQVGVIAYDSEQAGPGPAARI